VPKATKPFKRYPTQMDAQADEPVRKTEGGRYGENSEMSPHTMHPVTDDQKQAFSYASPSRIRNKQIDKMIEEDGG
jgi:hypothetical protein